MFIRPWRIAVIAVAASFALWRMAAAGKHESSALVASANEPPDKDDAPAAGETAHDGDKSKDQTEAAEGDKHEEKDKAPQRVSHDAEGRTVVTLDAATQTRIGLKVEPAVKASYSPGKRAYGRLLEDPAASFTIRAPMAGFLRISKETPWPALGSKLAAGTAIGTIEPRFTAVERFDFLARAMDARAEVEELQASLRATRASLESKQRLNTGDKVVSERAIEEAVAKVKGDEARLTAAVKKAEICEAQADPKGSTVGAVPLVIASDGEVVEVTAGPDESTESGQALLRVTNIHRLIARVELPIGETFVGQVQSAQVAPAGTSAQPISARVIGPAPSVHPELGGQTLLLAIDADKSMLRPGMAVVAELGLAGEATAGVRIAPDAVLQYSGATWVYVQTKESEFVRRRIAEVRAIDGGMFVTEVAADEHVVVNGCGAILSEELKSLAAEEEE